VMDVLCVFARTSFASSHVVQNALCCSMFRDDFLNCVVTTRTARDNLFIFSICILYQ
jgi:hypothetical protein